MTPKCIPYMIMLIICLSSAIVSMKWVEKTDNVDEKIAHAMAAMIFFLGSVASMIPGLL